MDKFIKSILTNLGSLVAEDRKLVMKFVKLTLSKGHRINKPNCDVILDWKAKELNHLLVIDSLRACMEVQSSAASRPYYFRTIYKDLIRADLENGVYTASVKSSFEDVFAFHLVLFQIWKDQFLNANRQQIGFEDDIIVGFWSHVVCGH